MPVTFARLLALKGKPSAHQTLFICRIRLLIPNRKEPARHKSRTTAVKSGYTVQMIKPSFGSLERALI